MAKIRLELHEDVRGVVEGAEAATDWRRYIRNYPWASVGLALAVGYLIIPRRHRSTASTIQLAASEFARTLEPARARESEPEQERPKEKKKGKSLFGMAFGLVAPMAWRAAQGYAMQFAEQWLAQQMAKQQMAGGGGGLQDLAASFLASQQSPPQPQGQQPPGAGPRGYPPGPRF